MKKLSVKKLALAGMLCALCVVGSVFSFPMFGSKCAPIQHMVNIMRSSIFRTSMGCRCGILCECHQKPDRAWKPHGIPGKHGRCTVLWTDVQIQQKNHTDMCRRGAWYRHTRRSCSVSSCKICDAHSAGSMFIYIVPFLISTVAGSIVAAIVMLILKKNGALAAFKGNL